MSKNSISWLSSSGLLTHLLKVHTDANEAVSSSRADEMELVDAISQTAAKHILRLQTIEFSLTAALPELTVITDPSHTAGAHMRLVTDCLNISNEVKLDSAADTKEEHTGFAFGAIRASLGCAWAEWVMSPMVFLPMFTSRSCLGSLSQAERVAPEVLCQIMRTSVVEAVQRFVSQAYIDETLALSPETGKRREITLSIALPLSLCKAVMSEDDASFMPHYQIPKARSAAKRHLNCWLKPEDQDPYDLQRFMRMIHQCQPNLSKEYEDSWPVMAYLEIYLLYRIQKAAYLKRRFGRCRQRFNRCPDPIWFRYAHVHPNVCPILTTPYLSFPVQASETGAPFERNCQATVKVGVFAVLVTIIDQPKKLTKPMHHKENEIIKMVYPRNRVSVVIKKLRKESNMIPISHRSACNADNEVDTNPSNSCSSVPSHARMPVPSCNNPVFDFLSSARPTLAQFHSHFVDMGFMDDNVFKAFFSWPVDVQESMARTKLGWSMNPLQLHGLLVAMHAWREKSTT
ncbi:hypothetical protein EDD15DRAFT_2196012 [Pisolithus albus]|nr:hypothetical protein EDD15DRAFT_2196012 [Pisolithus albus]